MGWCVKMNWNVSGKSCLVTGATSGVGELSRRLQGTGVTANAVHPGYVSTGVAMNIGVPAFQAIKRGIVKCRQVKPAASALDREAAARLWRISEELTGRKKGGESCTACPSS